MDPLVTKLTTQIEKATNEAHQNSPLKDFELVWTTVQERADMPKHFVTVLGRRLQSCKQRRALVLSYDLLQFMVFASQLSLFTQISTKQFLAKLSAHLASPTLSTPNPLSAPVTLRLLQCAKCMEELFKPYEDMLGAFFQAKEGWKRKGWTVENYQSPYKAIDLAPARKQQAQTPSMSAHNYEVGSSVKGKLSRQEEEFIREVREKIMLTNEIIDNSNPMESVKGNALLLEMLEEIKGCESKITEFINRNPSQEFMELALAYNDDINITYRRFKDLQKNHRPQPFILTEVPTKKPTVKEHKWDQVQIVSPPPQQGNNRTSVQKPVLPFEDFTVRTQPNPNANRISVQQQPAPKQSVNIFDFDEQPQQQPKVHAGNTLNPVNTLNRGPSNELLGDLLGSVTNQSSVGQNYINPTTSAQPNYSNIYNNPSTAPFNTMTFNQPTNSLGFNAMPTNMSYNMNPPPMGYNPNPQSVNFNSNFNLGMNFGAVNPTMTPNVNQPSSQFLLTGMAPSTVSLGPISMEATLFNSTAQPKKNEGKDLAAKITDFSDMKDFFGK